MVRGLIGRVTEAARFFLRRRLPACREMTALMSESLDRRLTPRERAALRLHLRVCDWCARYLEHLRRLRTSLRERDERGEAEDATVAPPLSPEARDRIKRALEGGS